MLPISIIEAPSILGLKPSGVEHLPDALKAAGLVEKLNGLIVGRVNPLPYGKEKDENGVLNSNTINIYSTQLADLVSDVMQKKEFPLVLGGDCSILIGNMLALKRTGRYGLFFMDGHADCYQPEASTTGEIADMDLAIVSGRGPEVLADIENRKPLTLDEDIVVFGYRDRELALSDGSQDVEETKMQVFDLKQVKSLGVSYAASIALKNLFRNPVKGFWIHLDVDVLNDRIMPAVDYRMPDGLSFEDLTEILKTLLSSDKAIGMSIAIFNPKLDPDGSIAKNLVEAIGSGFKSF